MPILYGEYGNMALCSWHANSALYHRIRHWVLFFHQAAAISWHQNSKTYCGPPSNIWLGPEERGYTRILQRFSSDVDPAVTPCSLTVSAAAVHGHGLHGATMFAAYLYNTGSQASPLPGVKVTVDAPFSQGSGYWYDPVTGDTLGPVSLTSAGQQLTAPSFTVDVALKITAAGVSVGAGRAAAARAAGPGSALQADRHGVVVRTMVAGGIRAFDLRGRVVPAAARATDARDGPARARGGN